mmetsp:Transcript_5103/g.11265  ORF Transcript_5103/g.11265 Transcript_5103/m.11265 type:complete len:232 (-) Transcript_5103:77-772(-)
MRFARKVGRMTTGRVRSCFGAVRVWSFLGPNPAQRHCVGPSTADNVARLPARVLQRRMSVHRGARGWVPFARRSALVGSASVSLAFRTAPLRHPTSLMRRSPFQGVPLIGISGARTSCSGVARRFRRCGWWTRVPILKGTSGASAMEWSRRATPTCWLFGRNGSGPKEPGAPVRVSPRGVCPAVILTPARRLAHPPRVNGLAVSAWFSWRQLRIWRLRFPPAPRCPEQRRL